MKINRIYLLNSFARIKAVVLESESKMIESIIFRRARVRLIFVIGAESEPESFFIKCHLFYKMFPLSSLGCF